MTPKQTIESVYDAFSRGDIRHIVGLVAPNAVWRQSAAMDWMFRWRVEDGRITLFDSYVDSAAITAVMS